MNAEEQALGMEDSRLEILKGRRQKPEVRRKRDDGRRTRDKGQRTMDKGQELKDCFFSERSHRSAENKGDPKKRTQNEAIRNP